MGTGAKGSRAGRDLVTPRSATTKEMKKMKMRTSALVRGQQNELRWLDVEAAKIDRLLDPEH